ncbi:hypothetical protein LDO32_05195 [Luteimonas sp. Y-2-2-4F]|nr:hypothetical protein [Luteimonas sp. Y-2-2-4F]MCD9031126.1 hypothetical protein [Luteimonas sp. Y-2-2-4F]
MNDKHEPKQPDANRDPITGRPGAHPVGVAAGGTAGAIAGAAIGSLFGPIGTLVGGAVGTIGGAAGGKAVAERVDPTVEVDYWRASAPARDYYAPESDYDRDYAPAYRYGTEARNLDARGWEDAEPELRDRWEEARGASLLSWNQARPAVEDAYARTDRTYRTYEDADRHYGEHYAEAEYYSDDYTYDDYRAAYRYGTRARTADREARWDEETEARLGRDWERERGDSRLSWEQAKHAVRDAWHRVERALPGDADRDGR